MRLIHSLRLHRVRRLWQSLAAPVQSGDMTLSSSATVNAQIWFSQFPLRPTAVWAVVAAMLAAGWLAQLRLVNWREVALMLLLADLLWGSVWRLAAGRLELLPLRQQDISRNVWLPYLQPGSPAARLLGRDDNGVLHLVLRVVLPTTLLALAIALVLGPTALWLTCLVIVIALLGWIVRHSFGYVPALLHSIVTIALPWGLCLAQIGATLVATAWPQQIALLVLWTVHNWGEGRLLRAPQDYLGIGLLALGDLGLAVLLIAARTPLWLALLAILWRPTWMLIYQRRPLHRLNFWWLAAMLISGLALGQVS